MPDPTPLSVLYRTRAILRDRGWANTWSTGSGSNLNIRSAISIACTGLVGPSGTREWHNLYLAACDAITKHLQTGISYWEYRVQNERRVEDMLTEVIRRMEKGEIKAGSRQADTAAKNQV